MNLENHIACVDANGCYWVGSNEAAIEQLLDYVASNPVASVRFHASDMILQIHSDASYLTETKVHSRVAGHFFLGKNTKPLQPMFLNGNIHTLCGILKHVVSSASEAELAALFMNAREGNIMRLTLIEMKHPQPATPIHTDNTTADGIVNGTVKRQCSCAIDMCYYWIVDQSDLLVTLSAISSQQNSPTEKN